MTGSSFLVVLKTRCTYSFWHSNWLFLTCWLYQGRSDLSRPRVESPSEFWKKDPTSGSWVWAWWEGKRFTLVHLIDMDKTYNSILCKTILCHLWIQTNKQFFFPETESSAKVIVQSNNAIKHILSKILTECRPYYCTLHVTKLPTLQSAF